MLLLSVETVTATVITGDSRAGGGEGRDAEGADAGVSPIIFTFVAHPRRRVRPRSQAGDPTIAV